MNYFYMVVFRRLKYGYSDIALTGFEYSKKITNFNNVAEIYQLIYSGDPQQSNVNILHFIQTDKQWW